MYVSNSTDSLVVGIPTAFYFKGVSVEPLYHFNSFVTFFGGLSLSSVNTSGGITFFGHLDRNWTGNYENTITGAMSMLNDNTSHIYTGSVVYLEGKQGLKSTIILAMLIFAPVIVFS